LGLIIYDEVHLLPAPVFRVTAEIQPKEDWSHGNPVREDGGKQTSSANRPKKVRCPLARTGQPGLDCTAECHEIRVGLTEDEQ